MIAKIKHYVEHHQKTVYIILDIPMFIFTFAFIVMTGNVLEPEPLTLFNAALGIFTVFSTVGIALQTVIARRIAAAQKIIGSHDFLIAAFIVGLLSVLPFALPEQYTDSLRSVEESGIFPFIILLFSHAGISFCRGILQGTERFYGLWSAQASEHVFRLIILYFLMDGSVSLNDAWITAVSSSLIHFIYALWLLPKEVWIQCWNDGRTQEGLSKEIIGVILSNFFLNYFLSVDLIVVGETLGEDGGAYVTANKFGKLLYFVGASIAIVILPKFSRAKTHDGLQKQMFIGLLLFIPLCALLSPIGAIMVDPLIRISFPEDIVPSFALMSWTFFANFALCAIQLLITWHIAQRTRHLNWLLAVCCLTMTRLLFWQSDTGMEVIQMTSASVWLTTIILSFLAIFQPIEEINESNEAERSVISTEDSQA